MNKITYCNIIVESGYLYQDVQINTKNCLIEDCNLQKVPILWNFDHTIRLGTSLVWQEGTNLKATMILYLSEGFSEFMIDKMYPAISYRVIDVIDKNHVKIINKLRVECIGLLSQQTFPSIKSLGEQKQDEIKRLLQESKDIFHQSLLSNHPAFPQSNVHFTEGMEKGFTKREYIAIHIFQGLLSGNTILKMNNPKLIMSTVSELTDVFIETMNNNEQDEPTC